MAQLIGNRIREKKAAKYRDGKDLYYTPKCKERRLGNALESHEFLWKESGCLSEEDKKKVSSKWMREIVGKLVEIDPKRNKKAAREFINNQIQFLGTDKYVLSTAEIIKRGVEERETNPINNSRIDSKNNLQSVVSEFLKERAERLVSGFPGYDNNMNGAKILVEELLNSGNLMVDRNKKIPKEVYKEYRKSLTKREVEKLSKKVIKVQTYINWGKLIQKYLIFKNILSIRDVDATHVKGYKLWRDSNKVVRPGKPISIESLQGELAFFKSLYEFAVTKELAPAHKLPGIKKIKPDKSQRKKSIDKPILPLRLVELLSYSRTAYNECPESKPDWKKKRKQNWYAILTLVITGCRPDELNSWKPIADKNGMFIESGKTNTSTRLIVGTPTLMKILEDKDFRELSGDIASRLNQWLDRHGFGEITPYRFRHTSASIQMTLYPENASQISEQLGHANLRITKRWYTNIGTYLRENIRIEDLKAFWEWLTKDYFEKPEKTDFISHPAKSVSNSGPIQNGKRNKATSLRQKAGTWVIKSWKKRH